MDKTKAQHEPKPDLGGRPKEPLKIDMEWEDAVRKVLGAGKPEGRNEDE